MYFSHEIDVYRPDYRSATEPFDKPVHQVEPSVNLNLIRACEEGQGKARLAYLLSKGADIEFRDESNFTPLHHAVFSGPVESVEFLLDAGADINAMHQEWKVPLCIAIIQGRPEIVKTLLRYKASMNIDCGRLRSPAHAACAKADMTMLRLLHREGANFAKQKHVNLGIWSVLIHGKIEPARRILVQYSSPGALAIALGKHEVVEWCLGRGLFLDETWIHVPCEWLDDSPSQRTLRLADMAARTSHESKSTILMMAASHLDHLMVEMLLAKGADAMAVDSTNYDGYNAIFHAVNSDKNRGDNSGALEACVSILQKHGASIDAQGTKGATALMKAVEWYQDRHGVVSTLLDLGASIDVADDEGSTALILASVETAELLCVRGADVNLRSSRGTALDLASDDKEQVLLRHGALPTPSSGQSVAASKNSKGKKRKSGKKRRS
jgi:ankyrin repeat protein